MKNFNEIYSSLMLQNFDGLFIRWPKIGLILDDSSGSSLLTQTNENPLFKFLTT